MKTLQDVSALAWLSDHLFIIVAAVVFLVILYTTLVVPLKRMSRPKPPSNPQPAPTPAPAPEPKVVEEPPKPKLPEHITPPTANSGFCLSYFYPDVKYIVPPECEAAARAVPPLKQLSFRVADDGKGIILLYEDTEIGQMEDNRIRQMVHDYNTDDRTYLAASREWSDPPMFSLALYESFSKIQRKWETNADYKEFTLVGNANAEMQDNIFGLEPGVPVEFDFDADKDKHVAIADWSEIGYAPAAAEKYFEEHENVQARILSITEKDSGKYSVRVMVIPE